MIVSPTPADHAIQRAQWLQCADGLDTGRDVNMIIIPSYSLDWSRRSPVDLLFTVQALTVCREKALISSGCESRPANWIAPAGSTWNG